MPNLASFESRREFFRRLARLGVTGCALPLISPRLLAAENQGLPDPALKFPGPWQFQLPKGSIILVSDQQLEDLQDPDKTVDLSLSATPNPTTLRKVCEQTRSWGGRTLILAFDEFWTQYRPGQGGKPREFTPDTDECIRRIARISQTLKSYGLGLELSLLSPLEVGRGYARTTGESGLWVQYREGFRDPATGKYTVSLWEQRRWTNNKGTIQLKRLGVRVFAFREQRLGGTSCYAVNPAEIKELKSSPELEVDEASESTTRARRLTVRGQGEADVGRLNRVLVVVRYATPEMDYFSPKAMPFLEDLVSRYHSAGVPLNGLYADEMHIQQDWGYFSHHDEGQFAFRYLTPSLAQRFAALYGQEWADLEKFLVYFCYGQHGFLPNCEARLSAQHVFGHGPEDIQRACLLRRRYFDLLHREVVGLFARAKEFAEKKYGHALEARAHATWAQSPTCDLWHSGNQHGPPRHYEYTPDFLWSNTVQQAASACDDYFRWNDFLTGGGNDHAEGGWSDRNYYGRALACSTGILNPVPYAYAAAWGMPAEVHRRHQAVCDAFGVSASPWFQAVQDSQHRDTDVLMFYPLSLVACEERFGSWMVQYGYSNYVTPQALLASGRVTAQGQIEMASRRFGTLAVLFEPLPPAGLLELLEQFVEAGGKLIWSGPPPRLDFAGQPVLGRWQKLLGIKAIGYDVEGLAVPGKQIRFSGKLRSVPPQAVLTDFLVDLAYPVEPESGAETVAQIGRQVVGVHRAAAHGGSATFLGFRPRDDQAASLGEEVRTWFEILFALGAYPKTAPDAALNDNPSVISRTMPYVACRFPNGTTSIAAHYRTHEESWPGGFHRDAKQDADSLARNPLPSDQLKLLNFQVNGHAVTYEGSLSLAFRLGSEGNLLAFAGHQCRSITIDGREHGFASQPMALLAWAPVLPERAVAGGAVLEIWAGGQAEVSLPLPPGLTTCRLFLRGSRPGTLGAPMACRSEAGKLRFQSRAEWHQQQLFCLADGRG